MLITHEKFNKWRLDSIIQTAWDQGVELRNSRGETLNLDEALEQAMRNPYLLNISDDENGSEKVISQLTRRDEGRP